MKKRLGIARALLHEPEILFLDEPTTGLDPEGARDLIDHIARLNRERQVTIILCTHLLKQVEHLCHRFIFLHDGRAIEQGTLSQIEAKYLGEVSVKVETDLAWGEAIYRRWHVEERGEGYLVFRAGGREQIPDLLRDVLDEAPIYSAEIVGRDLETLYFRVRSAANE
jgi:ABC-2 type transport system ATP-binding protein